MVKLARWGVMLCLAACAGAGREWSPRAGDEALGWCGRALWRGQLDAVLAADEGDAVDTAQWLSELRAAVAAETGTSPPPVLAITWSEHDALLADGADAADQHVATLQRLQVRRGGTKAAPPPTLTRSGPGGPPAELDRGIVARLVVAAVPADAPELQLPAALAAQWRHVVVLPTPGCVHAAAEQVVEAGYAANDVGWAKRQMIALVADPVALVEERLEPIVRQQLVLAWQQSGVVTAQQAAAVCVRLGIDRVPTLADEPPRGPAPDERLPRATAEAVFAQIRGLARDDARGAIVGCSPSLEQLYAMRSLDIAAVVDLDLAPCADAYVLGDAPRYLQLPCRSYLPDRAAAQQLEQARAGAAGAVFVCDDDADRPAALWAAHAVWVRGEDVDEAVTLAQRLGLDRRLAEDLRQHLLR